MSPAGFEPAIPAGKLPRTKGVGRAATGVVRIESRRAQDKRDVITESEYKRQNQLPHHNLHVCERHFTDWMFCYVCREICAVRFGSTRKPTK